MKFIVSHKQLFYSKIFFRDEKLSKENVNVVKMVNINILVFLNLSLFFMLVELLEQRRRQQEHRERELLEQAERESAEREMQRKLRERYNIYSIYRKNAIY